MKFSVGLQTMGRGLLQAIGENKDHIREVYFSWGDFPNGRSSQLYSETYTPRQLQQDREDALKQLAQWNIPLNLLFNATCYGAESQSYAFFDKIGQTVDYIRENFGLQSVTTTSPLIAKFIKANFPEIQTRASVNMSIGTIQGMDYIARYFDSYYMKRELNRDFEAIEKLSAWCKENGKKLHILANSGCLNHCSAHVFHDNLVSHEQEISKMDNAYQFTGLCREYLQDPKHYKSLIEDTSFIRPEDVPLYEPYFDAMKLATRVHRCPELVLNSYIRGRYAGNILELLEPAHNIYPYVVENGSPLRLVNIQEEGLCSHRR